MTKLVDTLIDKETGLDERDKYFLDVLFDQASGDVSHAMKLAGYPKDYSANGLRKRLSKEIKKASKDYILSNTAKAAVNLVKVFEDPNLPGTKNIITAAKEILDRGDVNKEEEKFELPDNAIVILPPKRDEEIQ